jgi:uncharacterized protein YceH (UPF0502 family)
MVHQAVSAYHRALTGEGGAVAPPSAAAPVQVDLDGLRRELKLQLPTAQATLDYSLQMRSEAFVRFGFDRFLHWINRLLRRDSDLVEGEGLRALRGALARMRREMEVSIRSHLLNHRENIKFQYLLKLADAAGEALYRQLSEQYSMQIADLAELDGQARTDDPRRGDLEQRLAALAERVQALGDRLNDHRRDLEILGRSYQRQDQI